MLMIYTLLLNNLNLEQSMMSKKDYPDYYTVDLEKEISRSGEHGRVY